MEKSKSNEHQIINLIEPLIDIQPLIEDLQQGLLLFYAKALLHAQYHKCHLKRKGKRSDPVLWQKLPYHQQKIKRQHKDTTKNFDYTTITDRLRMVSWSNLCHPTGLVKPVYVIPTFPLIAKAV